jgi:hypothetical protein
MTSHDQALEMVACRYDELGRGQRIDDLELGPVTVRWQPTSEDGKPRQVYLAVQQDTGQLHWVYRAGCQLATILPPRSREGVLLGYNEQGPVYADRSPLALGMQAAAEARNQPPA